MGSLLQFFAIMLPFFSLTMVYCMLQKEGYKPYIVYMGSPSGVSVGVDESSHLNLLSSLLSIDGSERRPLLQSDNHASEGFSALLTEERRPLLRSYNHAFRGFSALLTEDEASVLSGHEEVVSVFPDPKLQLHTTRSWDFLQLPDSALGAATRHRLHHHKQTSSDVIIGIIDTGIWPESPSFNDSGMGKIPSKWKGICEESSDFNRTNCNRKLIGARAYNDDDNSTKVSLSPRDFIGHGTHTASIAGGARVTNANYYSLAKGTARGGFPSARIASYKACGKEGCSGSAMLKAFDDAIGDGVDIISVSIGSTSNRDFQNDPIAIGAFHAAQKGVMVVTSAGNSGPDPGTVVNSAPWLLTVAASTTDRTFQSKIILGNGKSFEGTAINFSPLKPDERFPLAFAQSVAAKGKSPSDARNCFPTALDPKKASGKIIVCMHEDRAISKSIKRLVVEDTGAKGMILVQGGRVLITPSDSGTYPFSEVDGNAGAQILKYINSTKNPSATILASRDVNGFKPAPVVASFSSRGPGSRTENILKPDVMAPGVNILAAFVPMISPDYDAPGNKSSTFALRSGTSMACPHVSGAAAFVKSLRPSWSSSLIKSALITTASISNNLGKIVTNASYSATNPHESGAGEISPMKSLDPGLGFETSIDDHFRFLCYYGYTQKQITLMTGTKFTCPKNSSKELISSINYPTISIAALKRGQGTMKVKRVATNVGSPNSTYVATVNSPTDLGVTVNPRKLVFGQDVKEASFRVVFDAKRASKGYKYGDVSWSDGSHLVRLVFAVNVK